MNKQAALRKIAREIEHCDECKKDKIGMAVPGEGNPDADIVFIGEAPGKTESTTGRPFVGRSGKLLRTLINEVGLKEENIFITSPVKYLPKRGTPTQADITHGKTHLDKQLKIIDPKIIVLMGSTACLGVLGEKIFVMKDHGKIVEKEERKYLIMLHPAAAIRFQKFRGIFMKDFTLLPTLFK